MRGQLSKTLLYCRLNQFTARVTSGVDLLMVKMILSLGLILKHLFFNSLEQSGFLGIGNNGDQVSVNSTRYKKSPK